MKPTTKKKNRTKPLRKWAQATRKKQKGGFLSLIIAGLVAMGMSASAAAATAAVAAPIVSASAAAAAGYGTTKLLKAVGGSRGRIRPPLRVRSRMSRR